MEGNTDRAEKKQKRGEEKVGGHAEAKQETREGWKEMKKKQNAAV